jgi:putative MATE family efflux protein
MSQAVVEGARVEAVLPLQAGESNSVLLKQLLALALPVLAEHLLHILVGLNDTYLANHLPTHKAEAAAAVGTVQYIFWFLGLFAGAIGTGSTAIIARAIGGRHRSRANSACGQSMLFALFVGIGLTLFLFVFASPVAKFTSLQGVAHDYALSYLRMLSPSVPFLIVMFVANACLRGAGDTLTPAISMIVVDVVNIFLSWTLTFGWLGMPRLGFEGIAIGTIVAYIVGGVLQVIVLLVGRGGIQLHLHRLRPHWRDMKRIMNIGLPNGAESLINWVANFAMLKIVNQTRPINVAAAAHNAAVRIESISYMTGFAISTAVATMVGQSLGMRDSRRAERCAYLAYGIGGGFMTFVGLCFIFLAQYPAAWMAGDPAIRDLTASCLRVTGFCQAGFAAAIIFSGALRGAGDTFTVMLLSLVSVLIFRLGGVMIVGGYFHQPLPVIWIVLAADLFIRGVVIYIRFVHGGWKKIEV